MSLSHRCSACGKAAENAEKARISLLVRGVRVKWENIFAVCAGVEFSCKAVFRKKFMILPAQPARTGGIGDGETERFPAASCKG